MTDRGETHWARYNDEQPGRPVRPLARDLIVRAGDGGGRQAVDLGCGAGIETAAFLQAGWRVHAIDSAAGTIERVRSVVNGGDLDGLTVETVDMTALKALPRADLVYAGYSIFYTPPAAFAKLWSVVRGCLRPGGWLAMNFLGDRDGWAGEPGLTFMTAAEVRALFDGMEIEHFTEEDTDGPSYSGTRHWHVFDVIGRAGGE